MLYLYVNNVILYAVLAFILHHVGSSAFHDLSFREYIFPALRLARLQKDHQSSPTGSPSNCNDLRGPGGLLSGGDPSPHSRTTADDSAPFRSVCVQEADGGSLQSELASL